MKIHEVKKVPGGALVHFRLFSRDAWYFTETGVFFHDKNGEQPWQFTQLRMHDAFERRMGNRFYLNRDDDLPSLRRASAADKAIHFLGRDTP